MHMVISDQIQSLSIISITFMGKRKYPPPKPVKDSGAYRPRCVLPLAHAEISRKPSQPYAGSESRKPSPRLGGVLCVVPWIFASHFGH
jgi:hypothetical protein